MRLGGSLEQTEGIDMLPFTKMHGLGNDFVMVDCRQRDWGDWSAIAPRLAHRRLGVGCDQVLLLRRSLAADFRMDIYNADGSRAEMCGNGARCFARYLREKGISGADVIRIETLAGVVTARFAEDGIEIDMGRPEFEGRHIPADRDGLIREHPVIAGDRTIRLTCVSMGNPHAVVFVDDAETCPVEEVGRAVEHHPLFPNRTNVEFVQVLGPERMRMRVWERGAGVTMACGTGACAAAVASHWTGRTGPTVTVVLDGGELAVRWDPESSTVFLAGPAVTVFEGSLSASLCLAPQTERSPSRPAGDSYTRPSVPSGQI